MSDKAERDAGGRPSRLPRWMHAAWAFVAGYFWLPCPDCGRMVGGHEDNWVGVKPTDHPGVYGGVCRDCAEPYVFGLHGWHSRTGVGDVSE